MADDGKVVIKIDDEDVKDGIKNLSDYQEAFDDFDTSDFTVEIDGVQKSVKKLVEEINKGSGFEGFEKSLQDGKEILDNFAQAGAADIDQLKKLSNAVNNAENSLKKVKPPLDDAAKGVKKVAEENKKAKDSFFNLKNPIDSVKSTLVNLFSAYLGYQGIRSVINYAYQATIAFRTQERAVLSLNTTLKNAGVYTSAYSQQIQNLASEIQSYSNYGDEAIIKALALGQAYAGQIPITERATKAVVDFAAATGMDLEQAFSLFGKSVGTSTNALGRYGVQLEKGMSKAKKMEAITKQLGDRYTGQARQMADATVQLKNTLGDLSENIGEILNPALQKSATYWKEFTQRIIEARQQMKLLATENQNLGTLENAVNKRLALQGELYKLEDKFRKGGTTRDYYNKRKAELEQEIKFAEQWQIVYAKRQKQEEIEAKRRKAINFNDEIESSTKKSKNVEKAKDAYEKLQEAVAKARREIELAALAHGTSSVQVQNAFTKYQQLNGKLQEINKLFESEKIKVEEQKGAYQQLNDKVSSLTAKLRDLGAEHKIGTVDWNKYKTELTQAKQELDIVNKSLEENGIKVENVSKSISSTISSGIVSALRSGGNAFDVFSGLATTALQKILDKLLEISIITPIINSLTSGFGGGFFKGLFSLFGFKDGAAFQNGKVLPFAKGGIVNKPTLFPMANGGTGLMGEAGAEAVMPLKRMSNGKLGVQADNKGGQVVNIYNYSNSQVETRKRDDNTMDVFIRRVNEALSNERTSNGFRNAYSRENSKGVQAV